MPRPRIYTDRLYQRSLTMTDKQWDEIEKFARKSGVLPSHAVRLVMADAIRRNFDIAAAERERLAESY